MQSISTRHLKHVDFFADEAGRPFKFRIQPGFSSALRSRLEDGITSHGGLVITKIPIRGFVVIDPKSRVGRELVREWVWDERPGRHFVSYSFVLQCMDAKQLLSVEEHVLRREESMFSSKDIQPELSTDAKDKLALYLATVLPDPTSGARSSNRVYQRLVQNRHRYPWVRDHSWKIFRNHYCKNKKYYDRLISAIIKERRGESGVEAKSQPLYFPPKQFLITKKTNNNTEASVVEVVIPNRKKATMEKFNPIISKKVKDGKHFVTEHKRKFGHDITNADAKNKTTKKLRTIDDMLKEPLPAIVTEGSSVRLPASRVTAVASLSVDVADVEVGRAISKKSNTDIWIDDKFKHEGKEDEKQTARRYVTSGPHYLDRFQESMSFYCMDLDDLRSAAALDAMNNTSDVDCEDETSVAEILGLPTAKPGKLVSDNILKEDFATTKATYQLPADSNSRDHGFPMSIAILELAQCTYFTVEEVEDKLAGFSGDMEKTRDFFMRCRQLVEDLFAGSSVAKDT